MGSPCRQFRGFFCQDTGGWASPEVGFLRGSSGWEIPRLGLEMGGLGPRHPLGGLKIAELQAGEAGVGKCPIRESLSDSGKPR